MINNEYVISEVIVICFLMSMPFTSGFFIIVNLSIITNLYVILNPITLLHSFSLQRYMIFWFILTMIIIFINSIVRSKLIFWLIALT